MSKKLVILGAAESGVGAALLAKRHGYEVFVSDGQAIGKLYKEELEAEGIDYEENGHTEEEIFKATEIVKSPGIPETHALIKKIRKTEIPIISEIELAYRCKGNSKIVGITGSNGKTTCTSLLYHICKDAGLDCAMVGNIGFSFARQIATDPKELYIIEVSSFQLDDIADFRPDIAILTNITEDHLDRYEYDIKKYIASKFRITKNQTEDDIFIYNIDDAETTQNMKKYSIKSKLAPITMQKELPEGAYLTNAEMRIKWKGEEMQMSINDFALKGKHNQYNGMAASLGATVLGIRKERIKESMQTITTLEHRMEAVATIRGVDFINDSKATNTNSTWYALECMEKPVVLILGGVDKGNNYDALQELVSDKVKAIVCMGTDNEKIHLAFAHKKSIIDTTSAKEAVEQAYALADKGDIVLLSPACASFDLFKNYEDRGNQFKEAVRNL